MTALAHQPRPLHQFLRRVVRAIPLLDSQLMGYVRARRVRRSANVLEDGNFFPESRAEVLADYAYATARTHRGSIWITGKRLANIDRAELGALKGHEVNRANYDQCLDYLRQTGYPSQHIHLVKGWFQDTLKPTKEKIGAIALLRMDGDFYDSTKVVFEELYDQVVEGGVVIIDDYGSFEGCRRATEEFLALRRIKAHMVYVENSIRYFVKPETTFA